MEPHKLKVDLKRQSLLFTNSEYSNTRAISNQRIPTCFVTSFSQHCGSGLDRWETDWCKVIMFAGRASARKRADYAVRRDVPQPRVVAGTD